MNAITNEGRTVRRIVEVPDTNPLLVKKWLLDNGSHEVELIDETEETWEKYCISLREEMGK